jgi:8-oxo-dGTP pyrophosphatase MutT (NUDIX family)
MCEQRAAFVGKLTQKAILFGPDGDVLLAGSEEFPEPPGGTFEFGETLVGGLRRELSEELGITARVGPPVAAMYGLWAEDDGTPMVSLCYRCETAERAVTPNEEHEHTQWVAPETAATRLDEVSARLGTAVRRATELEDAGPFKAVSDPYGEDVSTEEVLEAFEAARTE